MLGLWLRLKQSPRASGVLHKSYSCKSKLCMWESEQISLRRSDGCSEPGTNPGVEGGAAFWTKNVSGEAKISRGMVKLD